MTARTLIAGAAELLAAYAVALGVLSEKSEFDCFRPGLDEAAEEYAKQLIRTAQRIKAGDPLDLDLLRDIDTAAGYWAAELRSVICVAFRAIEKEANL